MVDHERDRGPALTLGLIGAAALAGCVPRVGAELVASQAPPPARREQPSQPRPPGPDRTPPTIVRAELAGSSVRIDFSELVVVEGSFDPSDFRISFLRVHRDGTGRNSYAYYYDPGYIDAGTPMILVGARVDGERLTVEFAADLSADFCRQLYNGYDTVAGEAGLFLHYAAGSIPIADAAGNPLAEFGADWVARGRVDPPEQQLALDGAAALRAGTGLVRMACGPPIPPGPR
jgi:hypothetical protein